MKKEQESPPRWPCCPFLPPHSGGAQARAPTSGRMAELCPPTQGLGPPCGPLRSPGGRVGQTVCPTAVGAEQLRLGGSFDYLGLQRGWEGGPEWRGLPWEWSEGAGPGGHGGPRSPGGFRGLGASGQRGPPTAPHTHIWLNIGTRGMPSREGLRAVSAELWICGECVARVTWTSL